jgi:GAF domain-containing protein/anti-sigma regulatory factor (Ser/Thr protein kinase)
MRYRSKIVVPIVWRDGIFGALTFVRVAGSVPFDQADLEAAQELGRRAGLAVANAKQYGREHATQRRLALLVRAGELFHRSLELEETLSNVARMAVESFSDLCLFDLIDENTDRLYVSVGAHRDPLVERSLKTMVTAILEAETRGKHPARHVAQTGESFFVPVFDEAMVLQHASSDEHEAFMRLMGYRSKIVVPVLAHGAIFGALTFVRLHGSDPFDQDDMRAAEELGRRAGLAVANAKQYTREQHVAETLQRAFLNDEMPDTASMRFNAVYQPGADDSMLGGDWYDVVSVADRVVMTIGDVTGSGVDAARLMVQLRQWVRMTATITDDPGEILTLLNRALICEGREELATAFIAVLDRGASSMRYASAGHPPPLAKPLVGEAFALPVEFGPPLGVSEDAAFATRARGLDDLALLVLYTDGLTEVDRDPIAGEAAVKDLLSGEEVLFSANPARYISRLASQKATGDDMAILTARFGTMQGRWAFDVADSAAAYAIKRDFLTAVRAFDGDASDVDACAVIFGELVGNVLRHAPGRLSLGLSVDAEGVWLHVMDEGRGFEGAPSLPYDIWSESGRGLFLVHALARDVRIRRLPYFGTYVKALLPRRADRTASCGEIVPKETLEDAAHRRVELAQTRARRARPR